MPRAARAVHAFAGRSLEIEAEAHLGNFVETQEHAGPVAAPRPTTLAYLGDGDIGERARTSARAPFFATTTASTNTKTVIGADAFIGSDSQLVAPITIGRGAYVASGTTVVSDVPDDALALGRIKQENKLGYAPKLSRHAYSHQKPLPEPRSERAYCAAAPARAQRARLYDDGGNGLGRGNAGRAPGARAPCAAASLPNTRRRTDWRGSARVAALSAP